MTATVKAAFEEAFEYIQSDPEANLGTWGKNNPDKFYPLASKLIPLDIQGTVTHIIQPKLSLSHEAELIIDQLEDVIDDPAHLLPAPETA